LLPLVLLLFSAVHPQTKDEKESLKIQLDVSVWSNKKGYLKDLTEKDFEVYYQNELQKIELSAPEDKPLTIGVLFDVSASMQTDRKKFSKTSISVEGFKTFLKNDNPANEYFFITFGKEKTIALELTGDRIQIQNALDKIAASEPKDPNTILFDALKLGFEKFSSGKHSKQILFLITDGVDNDSEEKFKEIKKLFKEKNIPIYLMKVIARQDVPGPPDVFYQFARIPVVERTQWLTNSTRTLMEPGSVKNLEGLSFYTGGRVFLPVDSKEAARVFEVLAEELKTQYSLSFTPKNIKRETGERQKAEIKLALPKEKKKGLGNIWINTRQEYFIKSP
jgi:VWFA-related protein